MISRTYFHLHQHKHVCRSNAHLRYTFFLHNHPNCLLRRWILHLKHLRFCLMREPVCHHGARNRENIATMTRTVSRDSFVWAQAQEEPVSHPTREIKFLVSSVTIYTMFRTSVTTYHTRCLSNTRNHQSEKKWLLVTICKHMM